MIIDTKEIEMDFTTADIDGLVLVNPREIGIEIANQMLDNDTIWESDIHNEIELYLNDIFVEALNTAIEVLKENGRDDIL